MLLIVADEVKLAYDLLIERIVYCGDSVIQIDSQVWYLFELLMVWISKAMKQRLPVEPAG